MAIITLFFTLFLIIKSMQGIPTHGLEDEERSTILFKIFDVATSFGGKLVQKWFYKNFHEGCTNWAVSQLGNQKIWKNQNQPELIEEIVHEFKFNGIITQKIPGTVDGTNKENSIMEALQVFINCLKNLHRSEFEDLRTLLKNPKLYGFWVDWNYIEGQESSTCYHQFFIATVSDAPVGVPAAKPNPSKKEPITDTSEHDGKHTETPVENDSSKSNDDDSQNLLKIMENALGTRGTKIDFSKIDSPSQQRAKIELDRITECVTGGLITGSDNAMKYFLPAAVYVKDPKVVPIAFKKCIESLLGSEIFDAVIRGDAVVRVGIAYRIFTLKSFDEDCNVYVTNKCQFVVVTDSAPLSSLTKTDALPDSTHESSGQPVPKPLLRTSSTNLTGSSTQNRFESAVEPTHTRASLVERQAPAKDVKPKGSKTPLVRSYPQTANIMNSVSKGTVYRQKISQPPLQTEDKEQHKDIKQQSDAKLTENSTPETLNGVADARVMDSFRKETILPDSNGALDDLTLIKLKELLQNKFSTKISLTAQAKSVARTWTEQLKGKGSGECPRGYVCVDSEFCTNGRLGELKKFINNILEDIEKNRKLNGIPWRTANAVSFGCVSQNLSGGQAGDVKKRIYFRIFVK